MPKPSCIDGLDAVQRQALERELVRRNFADYDGLVAWAAELGLTISRSSAHRYGAKVKRRLQAVKDATEAARLIADAAPDDADLRSAAVISMVQSELLEVMVTLQDLDEAAPGERVGLLKEAARSVLDMTRASVMQKKWRAEIEAQVRADALQAAASAARAEGVSEQGLARIREALGIHGQ